MSKANYYYFYYCCYYHYYLLSQVSFSLVLILLNQWCTPPLRLQVSDCSTFLITCDVPNTAVFVEDLLNALLTLFTDIFQSSYSSRDPNDYSYDEAFQIPHLLNFCTSNSFQSPSVLRWPFAKFVDSPYYSESELCGGKVTVSFSKYLPWQAIHFLHRSTHLSKTCCRPLITSKFLVSEHRFHGWKSPDMHGARSELNSVSG
jgi:hypothetical protein